MTLDTLFLDAIKAAPDDTATRLVYADWLEERGDPRGELIRVEQEMRTLPVFSDRFWELKPQLGDFRSRAPQNWLKAMGYGTDCPLTIAHAPNCWKDWWRLIRVFTERWHRFPSLPDVSGHFAEVQAIEARLRRALPIAIREWVAFAHDVRRSKDGHDVLRGSYRLEQLDGELAISLFWKTDWNGIAARQTDLGLPDPPVYAYVLESGSDTFIPQPGPVLHSLTAYVLYYVVDCARGEGGGLTTDVDESSPLIRDLKRTFPAQLAFGSVQILDGGNMIALIQPSGDDQANRRVSVQIFRPMSPDDVPAFLWDYTRDADSLHGVFAHHIPPREQTMVEG